MGNKILTAWYKCDVCKEIKHGFEFDIYDNGRSGICDSCKNKSSERQTNTEVSEQPDSKALHIADVSKRLLSELRQHYLVNIDFDSGLPKADMKTIMKLWEEVNEFLGIKTIGKS